MELLDLKWREFYDVYFPQIYTRKSTFSSLTRMVGPSIFQIWHTVILTVNEDSRRAASDLQHHLNTLQTWFEKWRIRINENKSCSITFTLGKSSTPDLTINDTQIPRKTEIKYLGMTIGSKLTWKQRIVKKRKHVNITIKQLNWLLGRK
jgi:hypothetical protein